MKNILLCCSNIRIQDEGDRKFLPCQDRRTLYIMKNILDWIWFQVENVIHDEEGNLTFQLIDGEGEEKEGVTYKFTQQSEWQPLTVNESSKPDQFWSKKWAIISFSKEQSAVYLSLEEEAENPIPKIDPKRPIWSIPVQHQKGEESGEEVNQGWVRTRTPIKLDTSLDWEVDDREKYIEDEGTILDDPILSMEGEVTTINEIVDGMKTTTENNLTHQIVAPVVSESQCGNCGREQRQCLDGKPIYPKQKLLVSTSVISCGPYWGEKKRGRVGMVMAVLDQKGLGASKGQKVRAKWELGHPTNPGKSMTYPLMTSTVAQPIFNFHCNKDCSNCGLFV